MSRSRALVPAEFVVGRWHVRPTLNQICDGPEVRRLEPQVMDLLSFLASRPGRIASRDDIVQAVWGGRFIADATLTRSVADLRRALDDARGGPDKIIETIPKRGYRLVACVTPAGGPAEAGRSVSADAASGGPRIVVLPFSRLEDGQPDSFCEGLAQEVTGILGRVEGLRVIAPTSAVAVRGLDFDSVERLLGVTHVVEGSSRRSGSKLRVNARLVRLADRVQVWCERFDREVGDVFAVQDEIAAAIVRGLEVTLAGGRPRRPAPTRSVEAYAQYCEGRHHFLRGTRQGFERARLCYASAIALDGSFAAAHDATAELLWYLGFAGLMAPRQAFELALWECLRALEIDPEAAESHALLAMLRKELDYDWAQVDREFGIARALDPRSPVVRLRFAICGLMPHGRTRDAAYELESVVEADPLSLVARWWLAVMWWFSDDLARMRAQVERMRGLDDAHPLTQMALGSLELSSGRAGEAVASYERAAERAGRPPWLLGWFGLACGLAGRRRDALAVRDELQRGGEPSPPTALGLVAFGLGELDECFRAFDAAIDVRDPHIVPLRVYPVLAPVRSDPRYAELLRRLRLG